MPSGCATLFLLHGVDPGDDGLCLSLTFHDIDDVSGEVSEVALVVEGPCGDKVKGVGEGEQCDCWDGANVVVFVEHVGGSPVVVEMAEVRREGRHVLRIAVTASAMNTVGLEDIVLIVSGVVIELLEPGGWKLAGIENPGQIDHVDKIVFPHVVGDGRRDTGHGFRQRDIAVG